MSEARGPRSTGLGARQNPRNFRGQNIEIEKGNDISTTGPQVLMRAPKCLRLGARLAPSKVNLIFIPVTLSESMHAALIGIWIGPHKAGCRQ